MNNPRLMKLHLSVLTMLGHATPKKSHSIDRKLTIMDDKLIQMIIDCLQWVKPRNGLAAKIGIKALFTGTNDMPDVTKCMQHPWLCGSAGMAEDGKSITNKGDESRCLKHPPHDTGYEEKFSGEFLDGDAGSIMAEKQNVENKCIHFGERNANEILKTSDCGPGKSKNHIKIMGKAAGTSGKK